MRDLLKRLERLEAEAASDCGCAKAPWIRVIASHEGQLLADVRPKPAAFHCPRHGEATPRVIVRQIVEAIDGKPAPGFQPYRREGEQHA